jgi:hypothetical protein
MLIVLISILNASRIKMKMVSVLVLALSEQHRSALSKASKGRALAIKLNIVRRRLN